MKIKTIIALLICFTVMFSGSANLWAGEVDVLIEKLVEKQILTKLEAKEIVGEINKEGQKTKKSSGDVVPKWVKNTKFKADVRLRYQSHDMDNDGKPSRDRARIRARVGMVYKSIDNWEAGIGWATGGDDPRSTNQTLQGTFESPDIRLDFAYAKYSPSKVFSIMGGRIKNPIWGTKDLLWDGDIRPEGVAATLNFKLSDRIEIFATPAYFIFDEYNASKDDPAMFALQPGIKWKINDKLNLKFAMSYYNFMDVLGNDFSKHGSGTNSVDEDGDLIYKYNSLAYDIEIGFKLPKGVFLEYLKVFGQYVESDADSDNKGYLYGIKFGDKSLSHLKSWEFKVNYRELEKDAWLDFLPDSDFYGGATDAKGIEYELKFGLANNVSLNLDYYRAKPIIGNTDAKESLFQADLIVKF